MKVTLERVPMKKSGGWFRASTEDHPTHKMIHFVIQLTEEEKEIIKRSNLINESFEMPEGSAAPGSSRMVRIGQLLTQPECYIEPYAHNESVYMTIERGFEDLARTLSDNIKHIQQYSTGKRELDL